MKTKHVVGAGLIAGAVYLFYKASKGTYDKAAGLGRGFSRGPRGIFAVPGHDEIFRAAEWYANAIDESVDNGLLKLDRVNPQTGMTEAIANELHNVQLRGVEPYRMIPVDNMLGRCR